MPRTSTIGCLCLAAISLTRGFLYPPTRSSSAWSRKASFLRDTETSIEAIHHDTPTTFPHSSLPQQCRKDFSILERTLTDEKIPLVYLDSAATSQKPKQVLEILDNYYQNTNSNVHRGAHTLSREATSAYEQARDKIAKFIHANTRDEVIFTGGATESINLVAQSYARSALQPGDEILLTVAEHHANIVPWQILAQEKDLQLRFVHLDPQTGGLDMTEFEQLLHTNTKIVAFQHVSNVLGCINPVQEMVELVRKKSPDAKIVLDACQSVPHMPVDVQALGVDFLAASGHKMCGPTGIGFLWGKLNLLNSMPPYKGGGEMIDQVTLEGSTWQPAPARFEAGTPPIAQAIGLGAAIDYLHELGMDRVEAYEHEISEYLYDQLSQVPGITVYGPKDGKARAALAAFTHETIHPSDLSTFLDLDGVAVRAGHHCCQPLHRELGISHSCRASLYIYSTKEDVDAFVQSLKKTINFFQGMDTDAGDGSDGEEDFIPFI